MNKLSLKQVLYGLSLFVGFSLFVPACGMMDMFKEKAFKAIENKRVYYAGVDTIDKMANFISNSIVRLAHITRKNETAEQKNIRLAGYNQLIDQRLKKIEDNLKQDRTNAINDIYKHFNVINENQHVLETIVKESKIVEKNYMSQPHGDVIQDMPCPSQVLDLLKINNIHPTRLKVVLSTMDGDKDLNASAESAIMDVNWKVNGTANDLIVEVDAKVISPPKITIYPAFFNLPEENRLAVLGHEIGHLISQHSLDSDWLVWGISKIKGINPETICAHKSYKKLTTIQERQAEILDKNAEWASIMRDHRYMLCYPDHLFLSHYAQLTEIDELHKLKDKLKNYKPIPQQVTK